MPKVSVIIPVYGVEQYIERCARSLFEQSLKDIEYLFIDDCSPDKSIDVLMRVLEDYPHRKSQVIIHRMDSNSGQAAVRKWGMINSTGEYLIHCDGDDWVDNVMYEEMYKKASTESLDVVFCGHIETDGKNSLKEFRRDVSNSSRDSIVNRVLVTDDLNSLCCALVNKGVLSNIVYPTGNLAEDKTIMIQVCLNAVSVSSVDKSFYHYLRHPDSLTMKSSQKQIENKIFDVIANTRIVIDYFKMNNLFFECHKSIVAYIVYSHRICFKLYNKKLVRKLLLNLFVGDTKYFIFNTYIGSKFKIKVFLKILMPRLIFS